MNSKYVVTLEYISKGTCEKREMKYVADNISDAKAIFEGYETMGMVGGHETIYISSKIEKVLEAPVSSCA